MREVIVVGAGPVGLALALGLARRGREVLVLEKEEGTAETSRAPAIWPATQEILAGLGVVDEFLEEGIVVPRLRLHDADRDRVLLEVPLEDLEDETPFPHLLILSPEPHREPPPRGAGARAEGRGPLFLRGHERSDEIRRGVNRFTDFLTRGLLLGRGRLVRPALALVNAAMRIPPVRHRVARRLAMLSSRQTRTMNETLPEAKGK